MVPAVASPPTLPSMDQVTSVLDSPVTVAVNCWVSPRRTDAPLGEIEMPGLELPPPPPEPPEPPDPEPPLPLLPPVPAPVQLARKIVAIKMVKSEIAWVRFCAKEAVARLCIRSRLV